MTQQQHIDGSKHVSQPRLVVALPLLPAPLAPSYRPPLPGLSTPRSGA